MPTTWLITREADDARSEREAWSARGVEALCVPCLETRLLPWPWSSPLPERSPLWFFTSRRSVESWCAAGRPALQDVAALSPATAEALKRAGVTPALTAEGGAASLAEQVLSWWTSRGSPPTQVCYPTSSAGLHSAEQAEAVRLLSKLGEVDRRLVYDVSAPAGLRDSLEQAARGDWALSFASPSAVQHFFAAGAAFTRPPLLVACLGASTGRAWNRARPQGWPDAVSSREFSSHPEVTS